MFGGGVGFGEVRRLGRWVVVWVAVFSEWREVGFGIGWRGWIVRWSEFFWMVLVLLSVCLRLRGWNS